MEKKDRNSIFIFYYLKKMQCLHQYKLNYPHSRVATHAQGAYMDTKFFVQTIQPTLHNLANSFGCVQLDKTVHKY